jgi:hypothetical protein
VANGKSSKIVKTVNLIVRRYPLHSTSHMTRRVAQVRYCLLLQFLLCALVGGFAEMMDRQAINPLRSVPRFRIK